MGYVFFEFLFVFIRGVMFYIKFLEFCEVDVFLLVGYMFSVYYFGSYKIDMVKVVG